ncbi:hypothetical protein [Acinetobacter variabilis]|uniref:hypothetical protein n=1 Tax=Acinetobacter variabilis TaxID=70346 RepID=UPI0028B1870A|nr:hypothetical protein [Acinetobacter variabilis]
MPSSVKDKQFNPVMARQRLLMQAASQLVVTEKLKTGELRVKGEKLVAEKQPEHVTFRHRRRTLTVAK